MYSRFYQENREYGNEFLFINIAAFRTLLIDKQYVSIFTTLFYHCKYTNFYSFINKYSLDTASSVQSALKGLYDKEIISHTDKGVTVYDYFFAWWLRNRF